MFKGDSYSAIIAERLSSVMLVDGPDEDWFRSTGSIYEPYSVIIRQIITSHASKELNANVYSAICVNLKFK